MKVALVTDAWRPQVNGVVTTLRSTARGMAEMGHEVALITPEGFRTLPLPTYPEIRLSLGARRGVRQRLDAFAPHAVHIATEGPLGWAARAYCRRRGLRFTTSYHTNFPEYVRLRLPVPYRWSYAYLRRFHRYSASVMVTTPTMRDLLRAHGFRNLVMWPRGVDTELFRPRDKAFIDAPRPVFMYMGRVAVEKNLEAFLALDLPGTKYVVGDGPARERLEARYPDARFTGARYGEELAQYVAAADVFVFPSRTDTYGLVMLEAMACGVPVAAYPVTGPREVVEDRVTGVLDDDLRRAALAALELDPATCREYALAHDWQTATQRFVENLAVNPRTHRITNLVARRG